MSKNRNILFDSPQADSIWGALYGKRLLVAFSGGKDSLALLHYIWSYRGLTGWKLLACHVNHNLRGDESRNDAEFCKKWCLEHNIDYVESAVSIKDTPLANSRGLEHAARQYRYDTLEMNREKFGCDYIITAHTADDQLESFFVDILTGASIFTLGGIRPFTGYIARPMLEVPTDKVLEYIEHYGLSPVYDSSNSDMRYTRNSVREQIVPVIKSLGGELIAGIAKLQIESRTVSEQLNKRTANAVTHSGAGIVINRAIFVSLSPIEQYYLLGKWVSALCRGGHVHTEAIINQMNRPQSVRHNLPEGWRCEITPRTVRIFPAHEVAPFCVTKEAGITEITLPDGRLVKLPPELKDKVCTVRSRKDGDRFKDKKLKDLLERRKIDPYLRDRAAVAETDGKIVWMEYA